MSTNKTGNLELCLWNLTDAVKMSDFNEDNRKIDKAIAEARAETARVEAAANAAVSKAADANMMVKLMDVTVEKSNIYTLALDLSGVDLTQFSALRLCSVNSTDLLFYRMNGQTSGYDRNASSLTYSWSDKGFLDFHLCTTHVNVADCLVVTYNYSVKPSNLKTIELMQEYNASTALKVGRRFTLVGVKL